MRRNLVIAAIAAIAACGLGATPAAAAVTGPAAPVAVSSPALGARCTAVTSASPVRIGVICVTVIRQGARWRAEVSFKTGSGSLRQVSVKNLRFLVAGGVEERTGRGVKDVAGRSDAVPPITMFSWVRVTPLLPGARAPGRPASPNRRATPPCPAVARQLADGL